MEPLSIRVLRKELEGHPFGSDSGFAASWYLAEHTYVAIKQLIRRPAAAMDFLQKLARVLAENGKTFALDLSCGCALDQLLQQKGHQTRAPLAR